MTVYVARVQGWEDSYTLGVFTTEEEAMEAGRLYVQERELEDYSWVAEEFQVQGESRAFSLMGLDKTARFGRIRTPQRKRKENEKPV